MQSERQFSSRFPSISASVILPVSDAYLCHNFSESDFAISVLFEWRDKWSKPIWSKYCSELKVCRWYGLVERDSFVSQIFNHSWLTGKTHYLQKNHKNGEKEKVDVKAQINFVTKKNKNKSKTEF